MQERVELGVGTSCRKGASFVAQLETSGEGPLRWAPSSAHALPNIESLNPMDPERLPPVDLGEERCKQALQADGGLHSSPVASRSFAYSPQTSSPNMPSGGP